MACVFLNWCSLGVEAQAAWVQAVGSIVAIGVAIAVPYFMDRRKRNEDAHRQMLRARGLALQILPLAEKFASGLRISLGHAFASSTEERDLSAAAKHAGVPAELQALATQLHDLGAPAHLLQVAMARSSEARNRLNDADFYNSNHGVYQYGDELLDLDPPEDFGTPLREAIQKLSAAIEQMQALFK